MKYYVSLLVAIEWPDGIGYSNEPWCGRAHLLIRRSPWYFAIGPLVVIAVGFVLRRSRRGGGGPPGQGPFGGS